LLGVAAGRLVVPEDDSRDGEGGVVPAGADEDADEPVSAGVAAPPVDAHPARTTRATAPADIARRRRLVRRGPKTVIPTSSPPVDAAPPRPDGAGAGHGVVSYYRPS